jgi:hypothetical protein
MLRFFNLQVLGWASQSGGCFGAASASCPGKKEAANSLMTFTLKRFLRRFPNSRSGWRNGTLYRLS